MSCGCTVEGHNLSAITCSSGSTVEARARQSLGTSSVAIYEMVVKALKERNISGGVVVDVGCGSGGLWSFLRDRFSKYIGVDVVRYDGFPDACGFTRANLDTGRVDLPGENADVVVSVETIEHLENPRAFMRELVRLAKPGGWVIITTPNQQSLLSLLTLIVKGRFAAFQDGDYPAHVTALLEIDLRRIAMECGLEEITVFYSHYGRAMFTARHLPRALARRFPKFFSDNLLLVGHK